MVALGAIASQCSRCLLHFKDLRRLASILKILEIVIRLNSPILVKFVVNSST